MTISESIHGSSSYCWWYQVCTYIFNEELDVQSWKKLAVCHRTFSLIGHVACCVCISIVTIGHVASCVRISIVTIMNFVQSNFNRLESNVMFDYQITLSHY